MTNSPQYFWDFSSKVYRKPQVAHTCLELQNTHGIDVNLLLLCCWQGVSRGEIPAATLRNSFEVSAEWRKQVVQPLRDARTWMKNNALYPFSDGPEYETLREKVKTLELAAEKQQQLALEKLVEDTGESDKSDTGALAINANFDNLLKLYLIQRDESVSRLLAILTEASEQD